MNINTNRIKLILRNIISETQKVFLKGRYIGECTRLIYDLIDKLEEDDIPGLQVISGYHLISMRSHQNIDLINTKNHLFLPLLFQGHF
jgi:hypothetical protein